MPAAEMAQLLVLKAAQDEFTVRKLIDDPESPDEVIGFHAQQAVEKLLKAVLAFRGIRYRRTYNLGELMDLMLDNGISLPRELEDVRDLTPFAAELRYDEFLPDRGSAFDRLAALRHVQRTRAWAESLLT
jgi:HEPN domain-containing protein